MAKEMKSWNGRQWLIAIGVVVIAITAGALYFIKYPVRKELPPPNFAVKEYSLSGKITAINGNVLTLNVGRVYAGSNGNYVAYDDKTMTVGDKTVISKIVIVNGKATVLPGSLKDLSVGIMVSVSSNENIGIQSSFTPTRLDIMFP